MPDVSTSVWWSADEVSLAGLETAIAEADPSDHFPLADEWLSGVPCYRSGDLTDRTAGDRRALAAEWVRVLRDGAGVFVLSGAFPDTTVIDQATDVFLRIIAEERASSGDAGDHFGTPGSNARVWNAQQKLAMRAPEVFVEYFANPAIALASWAWLGAGYQMTSQVNLVYPGGQAQQPHRDYHLGFQSNESAQGYPAHVHEFSAYLTLQGAVAHCDMPVESGTTMLLPGSQRYALGYLAYRNEQIRSYFAQHHVQLPLSKGDVIFFSPALLHGAGTNHTTTIDRMANLLQVSSAFGRAMESLDRRAMCEAIYPELLRKQSLPDWSAEQTANVIASCAEGYPFPTNLDRDQPIGGLAPLSQADIMAQALSAHVPSAQVAELLRSHAQRVLPG